MASEIKIFFFVILQLLFIMNMTEEIFAEPKISSVNGNLSHIENTYDTSTNINISDVIYIIIFVILDTIIVCIIIALLFKIAEQIKSKKKNK
jgi:hypothetical protein